MDRTDISHLVISLDQILKLLHGFLIYLIVLSRDLGAHDSGCKPRHVRKRQHRLIHASLTKPLFNRYTTRNNK